MFSCSVLSYSLYDPMDCSLSDSAVHGILQARILDWVVIPFSGASLVAQMVKNLPAIQETRV